MDRYDWSRLSKLELHGEAVKLIKEKLTRLGCEVHGPEIDGKRIGLVLRTAQGVYDVRVKSSRFESSRSSYSYIFMTKASFDPSASLLAAVVLCRDGCAPDAYLVPSTVWREPNALFVSRDYIGKKSAPEWGSTSRGATYHCWSRTGSRRRSAAYERQPRAAAAATGCVAHAP